MSTEHDIIAAPAPPLTTSRARCAQAWRMVQTRPTGRTRYAHTADQIVSASGVSRRTVDTMREFDRTLRSRGESPSGDWQRDRTRAMHHVERRK